jgi:SpoVK/Ycf46/Vps4 family AAA+-type ATPase
MSSHSNYIKDIAKYGLENDQDKLLTVLNGLIEHFKKTNKINFALQLQSILKDSLQKRAPNNLSIYQKLSTIDVDDFIIEKLTSDYKISNLVCTNEVKEEFEFLIKEHKASEFLNKFQLPLSNKILFYGPPGCGKTLASYVLAGELQKVMYVIDLGAIVSSKLGETSKNLSNIFKKVSSENSIIFIDEFDSLGKIRDYTQDHGEMKRVVNTILQLIDYLPQDSIFLAATNQIQMIDEALIRRFDVKIFFDKPDNDKIVEIIDKTLHTGLFTIKSKKDYLDFAKDCKGLSYYSIQKALINSIKKTLLSTSMKQTREKIVINSKILFELLNQEKSNSNKISIL